MWRKWLLSIALCSALTANEYLVVDPYLSPSTGAYDIKFANHLLQGIDNNHFLENGAPAPLWKRILETVVWNAVSTWETTCQHEFFGHGYRLREQGIPITEYEIGFGSGLTLYNITSSTLYGTEQAITVAGLEAEDILAREIKMSWMKNGKIDPRSTNLYLSSYLSTCHHILGTLNLLNKQDPRGLKTDIGQFLLFLHHTYPNQDPLANNLALQAKLTYLDPTSFYAIYGGFYYLFTGATLKFPMIKIRPDLLYLPNLRTSIAPYGTEQYLENFLLYRNVPIYIYGKRGVRSVGFGLSADEIFSHRYGTLGGSLHIWQHSQFLSQATLKDALDKKSVAIENPNQVFGVALAVKNFIPLKNNSSMFIEIGAKTEGYLPGSPLSKCITLQLGYSL